MTDQQLPQGGQDLRGRAMARLKQKRDFGAHLFIYLVVNGFLIGIWAFTGTGFFWPVFLLFLWGIGLVLNAWDVYWRKPMSEEQIRREMERMRWRERRCRLAAPTEKGTLWQRPSSGVAVLPPMVPSLWVRACSRRPWSGR